MQKIEVLKKRKDFIRVAKGVKAIFPTLILMAAPSLCEEECRPKVGYTTTKKIGKANVRNKARRRMRAAVAEIFPKYAKNNTEYVLVGRWNTAICPFSLMKKNLKKALFVVSKELQNAK